MSPRSIRRAAERKAEKLARKQARQLQGSAAALTPDARNAQNGMSDAGAGPALARSVPVMRGQTKPHGLTGMFAVLQFESQEAFDELRDALRAEHQPATPTEILLVDRMAEHVWLSQRAQKFCDAAFLDHDEKMMALMLRIRTTHDRAFHKCLAELRVLWKERQEQEAFESQNNESDHSHEPSDCDRPEFESKNLASLSRDELRRMILTGLDETNRHLDRCDEALRIANEARAA